MTDGRSASNGNVLVLAQKLNLSRIGDPNPVSPIAVSPKKKGSLCEASPSNACLLLHLRSNRMSRSVKQPVGQKRLTNVAVVRLKKQGMRFEVACYKNKVLSWRTGVEKDLDEVLQSQTVYSNVSKGVLAKSKDLIAAFGIDDQSKICLEILDKGELQVAGKERESQLSSQFRDIATIVMQKTINPETKRPYTISMIERLMHEIHYAVDPGSNSKKQALEVIRKLQMKFPIKRSPMRLRVFVPPQNLSSLSEKLDSWNSDIVSKGESGSEISLVCELDPSVFRECDALVRSLQGRLEILAVSVHEDTDTQVDQYDEHEDAQTSHANQTADHVIQLSERIEKQPIIPKTEGEAKQTNCSTCNAVVGDAKQYRDHCKSEWHKHNIKRKTKQLPPLTAEECLFDMEINSSKGDLNDYSF